MKYFLKFFNFGLQILVIFFLISRVDSLKDTNKTKDREDIFTKTLLKKITKKSEKSSYVLRSASE